MTDRTGWLCAVIGFVAAGFMPAQTLTNQALNGKYFFRQLSLGTDGISSSNLVDPRSVLGTITFDGSGHFSFTGQQVAGNNAATTANGSGTYTVDPGGFVVIDSLRLSGAKITPRYAWFSLSGSATETTDNTFDLFVAIPGPTANAALNGPYWAVTLEFPGGAAANARNTQFSLNPVSGGRLADFSITGHAANVSLGRSQTQPVTGATYTLNADGTGTASFGAASPSQLLSGSKNLDVWSDGNVLIGDSRSTASHVFLIAVKAVSGAGNATWNNTFWGAGLRLDPNAVSGYSGSMAARGTGKSSWTRREKAMGGGTFDLTTVNGYTLNSDGSGTMDLAMVGLGAGGKAFVGSTINPIDPAAYEIFFGIQVPSLTGAGVFLNPLGVVNAASFAPPGNPISPGQFIALFGTGLAKSNQTATPPYPPTLNNVTVLINNKQAPLYFVSPGQINALVPYSTVGPTATIVVQNGTTNSNTVTVPVAPTSPGVYTLDQSGSGAGAILHADFGLVNAGRPAAPGETVLIYLTGMGAVNPPVADGTPGKGNPLSYAGADVLVLVGGQSAKPAYNGLAPGYPGLYQINVALPTILPGGGNLPLAIQTNNAYHDQVDIAIQ